jgi:pyridoxine 4-dehydrogenase
MLPRYQPEALAQNRKLVQAVEDLAARKGCTTAQVALGWILGMSARDDMPTIIPIPGAANPKHIRDNAETKPLSNEEMEAVEKILIANPVVGDRYHPLGMKMIDM